MVVTSYYGNHRNYEGYTRIAISRTQPENSYDLKLLCLAPSFKLLKEWKAGNLTKEQYVLEYTSQLKDLHQSGRLDKIVRLFEEGENLVLLCYEKKNEFCHRHILVRFLNEHYGTEIKEL